MTDIPSPTPLDEAIWSLHLAVRTDASIPLQVRREIGGSAKRLFRNRYRRMYPGDTARHREQQREWRKRNAGYWSKWRTPEKARQYAAAFDERARARPATDGEGAELTVTRRPAGPIGPETRRAVPKREGRGMVSHERVAERANARAQRRIRRMLVEQTYSDPTHRTTRLYQEAERLLRRINGEPEPFCYADLPEYVLDALHEATHAELTELADAAGLPDVPLAAYSEGDLRADWGLR